MTDTLLELSIDDIRPSTTNPRQSFDQAGLEELRDSILQHGIQVPLLVRSTDVEGLFEIVGGERRYRAAKLACLDTLPCISRELSDQQALEIQVIENLQRADVHPMEEADAYQRIIDAAAGWTELGDEPRVGRTMTTEDVALRVGKTASYVAQRLKLCMLIAPAKQLFLLNHMTLGHALLLARLAVGDQERALRFMMESDPKYDKRPVEKVVEDRLAERADEEKDRSENPEEFEDEYAGKTRLYQHQDDRFLRATESQLKRWISSNVLLNLSGVPWNLADAQLVPEAGACTSCPKRSGSNAALFGDLTAADDVCLDTVCFASKQDASLRLEKKLAKETGTVYLKLSDKGSHQRLEEIAVSNNSVVTKKTVKRGQWIEVPEEFACENGTVQGLMVDGPDKGKKLFVCADQDCKKHQHTVYSNSSSSYRPPVEDPRKVAARNAWMECERRVRAEIYQLITKKVTDPGPKDDPDGIIFRAYLNDRIRFHGTGEEGLVFVCQSIGLKLPAKDPEGGARDVLEKYVRAAKPEELWVAAFHLMWGESVSVSDYQFNSKDYYRKPLMEAAELFGLGKQAAALFQPKKAATLAEKKTVVKKTAKKAAKSPTKKPVAKKKAARK